MKVRDICPDCAKKYGLELTKARTKGICCSCGSGETFIIKNGENIPDELQAIKDGKAEVEREE